jgi:hypothetical protein
MILWFGLLAVIYFGCWAIYNFREIGIENGGEGICWNLWIVGKWFLIITAIGIVLAMALV